MTFVWLISFVILTLIEICTVNLVSIWFAVGAFVSLFVSMMTNVIWIQLIVFVVVSTFSLLITKPFMKKIRFEHERVNLDRVIGMEGVVIKEISKYTLGEVKVDGKRWSAKSDSDIAIGDIVTIEKIEGVKLIVRKKED